MKQDFEVISITQHKDGTAISLQNNQGGKVLGQLTLNLSSEEADKLKVKPGDNMIITVG